MDKASEYEIGVELVDEKMLCMLLMEGFCMKSKIKEVFNDKRILVFVCAIMVGSIIFWVAAALTDWQSTKTVFFRWDYHTFMDWFTEFMRLNKGNIYTGDEVANYPAFCFLIYRVFYAFVPKGDVRLLDGYAIRTMQQILVPYIIFMVFLIFMFYFVFKYELKDKTKFERESVALALLVSAPFIHVFERGNQIVIALLCTMVYVMLYNSEKKLFRIVAYISLSVAAAIKIYPAIFGVLTVKEKRYKESILFVIMGALTFLAPFALFDGFDGLIVFVKSIMNAFATYHDFGFGYDFSIYNLERLIISLVSGYQPTVSNISRIVVLSMLIVTYIVAQEKWQQFAVLVFAIIFLPKFSYFYTVGFLTIPLLYMFKEKIRKIHYLYLVEFLLVYIPWLYFPMDYVNFMSGKEFGHTLSYGHIIMYIGLLGLLVTILIEGIYYRIIRRSKDKI